MNLTCLKNVFGDQASSYEKIENCHSNQVLYRTLSDKSQFYKTTFWNETTFQITMDLLYFYAET